MSDRKPMSAAFVRNVSRPGRYGDGRGGYGLSLLVRKQVNGRVSKTWSQRVRINGKVTSIGLGKYPLVTLAEARQEAFENRRAIAKGKDPRGGGIPTFAEAAEKVIEVYAKGWKDSGRTASKWRSQFQRYVYPHLGKKRVDQITSADVLAALVPIWHTKAEIARKSRQRISAVMRWAIAEGHRSDNPAGDAIAGALPKQNGRTSHYRALPHDQVAGAIAVIQHTDAWPATKLAFEFLVLTATRSGEVRNATWAEIDWETATWEIPADRTKTSRPHRVPLGPRALEILDEALNFSDATGLVFPSINDKTLSSGTIGKLLKESGITAVAHGFRTSFRTWAAECTNIPREVAELALGHVNKDRVEAAYQRSDLFAKRRELMNQWGEYLTGA